MGQDGQDKGVGENPVRVKIWVTVTTRRLEVVPRARTERRGRVGSSAKVVPGRFYDDVV